MSQLPIKPGVFQRLRVVIRPPSKNMGPTGAGPYPPSYDLTGDSMRVSQLEKFFDNFNDGTNTAGFGVGMFGSQTRSFGRCPKCLQNMNIRPMEDKPGTSVGVKMQIFCPYCRPQLTISDPKAEHLNYDQMKESPDPGTAWNEPLDSEVKYDATQYPSQGPSMSGNQNY